MHFSASTFRAPYFTNFLQWVENAHGQICFVFGDKFSIKIKNIYAVTKPSEVTNWDKFIELHQHQNIKKGKCSMQN